MNKRTIIQNVCSCLIVLKQLIDLVFRTEYVFHETQWKSKNLNWEGYIGIAKNIKRYFILGKRGK